MVILFIARLYATLITPSFVHITERVW